MKLGRLLAGAALAVSSAWAIAQDAPESLLPPGFDEPPPAPAPAPAARPTASAPSPSTGGSSPPASSPVEQPLPGGGAATSSGGEDAAAAGTLDEDFLARLPSVEELEEMTPEELEEALGLAGNITMPPAARRSMERVGIIDVREGGFEPAALKLQNAPLIRALLERNRGMLVSRWGHIMLRRVLASRLDAPVKMPPAEFAAMRAGLLLRMGEMEAARALVQDVDPGNYTPKLTDAAFDSYVATADFTGICQAMMARASDREDPQWEAASAICSAYRGDGNYALRRLDRMLRNEEMAKIDLLLAQKYAGAAGKARRAVTIEWDDVKEMTPWRYSLTIAVGLEPPKSLMAATGRSYASMTALAPMVGLANRADAADRAGAMGVLSSSAMVSLYSEIYANEDVTGEWSERAEKLRGAYVYASPAARLTAMQELWNEADSAFERYSRMVLTAYAAARMPVDAALRDSAPDLIASMLTAGLDRNALRWAEVSEAGSQAWALLALAAPSRNTPVDEDTLDSFVDDDDSVEMRKSGFLLAGLAGLGRLTPETKANFEDRLDLGLDRKSRWTGMIETAADRNNAALVALLAATGMQGPDWSKMTPRYLFHIVNSLRRVGLEAEARMIAAEAVARG